MFTFNAFTQLNTEEIFGSVSEKKYLASFFLSGSGPLCFHFSSAYYKIADYFSSVLILVKISLLKVIFCYNFYFSLSIYYHTKKKKKITICRQICTVKKRSKKRKDIIIPDKYYLFVTLTLKDSQQLTCAHAQV